VAGEVTAVEGALKQGAQAVARSRGELQKELGALEGKLSVMGQAWTGQGAVAFQRLMTRWREDATKMVTALDDFERNLDSSSSTYDSTDDSQSVAMRNLASRLS
jgi:WXG100 family type VII secretion target